MDPARPRLQTAALERNLRHYFGYRIAFEAYFWLPVFFLYFSHHLPLQQVLRLEAIYYAGVVLLECRRATSPTRSAAAAPC